jgi:N-acetylmuramoyl-L-alanine amidase
MLLAAPAGAAAPAPDQRDRFDTVVIDAGHGGDDQGARGHGGILEKDLVLDVAKRLAQRLRGHGLRVVMTRSDNRTVPLETRTSIANDARGDLFISIHANSHRAVTARGIETYFASLEASDAEASRLAALENEAFGAQPPAAREDPLVALLGDMIATEHLVESQHFAGVAQGQLAADGGASRGVKQAPFVVLMGVQMPASLVEIGFISNPGEAKALRGTSRRDALADALSRAVLDFGRRYDAKRGTAGPLTPPAPGDG